MFRTTLYDPLFGSGLQLLAHFRTVTWGVAPGWNEAAFTFSSQAHGDGFEPPISPTSCGHRATRYAQERGAFFRIIKLTESTLRLLEVGLPVEFEVLWGLNLA